MQILGFRRHGGEIPTRDTSAYDRALELERAAAAERERTDTILHEADRVRRHATGLWATDLLAARDSRERQV